MSEEILPRYARTPEPRGGRGPGATPRNHRQAMFWARQAEARRYGFRRVSRFHAWLRDGGRR